MSKINSGLYSSEVQDWMTPPHLVDALLAFEGRTMFDLDPCCSRRNIPALRYYLDGYCDGLVESWGHSTLVFVNPPYGTALKLFMEKIWKEFNRGCKIWTLIPARTETNYQHDYGLARAGFTIFLKGRLHFLRNGDEVPQAQQTLSLFCDVLESIPAREDKDGAAPFPTMLLYFGNDWQEKMHRWLEKPPLEGTLMVPGNR
jgi:DNA N-6-adenine-methyltransferase (Dam)